MIVFLRVTTQDGSQDKQTTPKARGPWRLLPDIFAQSCLAQLPHNMDSTCRTCWLGQHRCEGFAQAIPVLLACTGSNWEDGMGPS